MIYTIKNSFITIKVDSFGAELKSLVDNKTQLEYLWQGNPVYWKRTSPILFPLVGSLKSGKYRYEGKEYFMSQHGFARDMEFELESSTEQELWFSLLYNEETLSKYPFRFQLDIGYRLMERGVKVLWKVTNLDNQKMYFSIGGHPAFSCPLRPEEERRKCFVKLEGKGKVVSHRIVKDGLVGDIYDEYQLENGKLPVLDHLFDKDALIIEESGIQCVQLLNEMEEAYLTVQFDAPLFGIWSPVKKDVKETAPFVCIEPWYGRCDRTDFEGDITEREWGNALDSGDTFEAGYMIMV